MRDQTASDYRLSNWLEANLNPEGRSHFLDISIPNLPSAEIQRRFTGLAGRTNLLQAFEFWKLIRGGTESNEQTKVLDFGCGWGRIARFWLLDLLPNQIFGADCLSDAIQVFNSIGNPFKVEHCDTRPPLLNRGPFDTISAYSVFSHLRQEYFNYWLIEFFNIMKSNGNLFITSRAEDFIDFVEKWQEGGKKGGFNGHMFPSASVMRARYENGDFQFYSQNGGGGELTASFYGQALIPESYIRTVAKEIGYTAFVRCPAPPEVNQAVFQLSK